MIVCPTCGKENEDFFKFCLGCGSDLGPAEAPSEPSRPASPPTPSVRRTRPVAGRPVAPPGPVAEAGPEPLPEPIAPPAPRPAPEPRASTEPVSSRSPVAAAGSIADFDTDDGGETVQLRAIPGEDAPADEELDELDDLLLPGGEAPADEDLGADPFALDVEEDVAAVLGERRAGTEDLAPATRRGLLGGGGAGATMVRPPAEVSAPTPPVSAAPSRATTTCRVCAADVPEGFAFCNNCGAPMAELAQPRARKWADPGPRSGVIMGRLVLIREDGSDGEVFHLDASGTVLGREAGHINFPDDDFLAPRHAEVVRAPDGRALVVRSLESTNGVFIRLAGEVEVEGGDAFRVGQELLHFELMKALLGQAKDVDEHGTTRLGSPLPKDVWGRLVQEIGPETFGHSYLLLGDDVYLGRERGDITFPEDGYVSGSHAVLSRRGDQVFLKDLGSSNGTYLRLTGDRRVENGDFILAGQQLFRVEL